MTSAAVGGGTLYNLRYDGLGRLYRTWSNGEASTYYTYDGDALIAEYSHGGTLLRRYIHGPGVDDPLIWYEGASTAASNRRFLHADERGSIVAITDNAGATVNLNRYDDWGIPSPGNIGRFGYTGQIWLDEIGLSYYKARFYSPQLGRFLQTDPIGYEDGMNMYAYVGNDPMNAVDPTGMDASCAQTETHTKCEDPGHEGIVVEAPGGPSAAERAAAFFGMQRFANSLIGNNLGSEDLEGIELPSLESIYNTLVCAIPPIGAQVSAGGFRAGGGSQTFGISRDFGRNSLHAYNTPTNGVGRATPGATAMVVIGAPTSSTSGTTSTYTATVSVSHGAALSFGFSEGSWLPSSVGFGVGTPGVSVSGEGGITSATYLGQIGENHCD